MKDIPVSGGTNDQDFTVGTCSNNLATNENAVNVKTLERCFNGRIDREMNNIVDTVEDRIENAILTAIDSIVAPKIELEIGSKNAPSGRNATSATANSERGEQIGIIASFEKVSEINNVLSVPNVNDETRNNIPDEVSGLSFPESRFDWQIHTHHIRVPVQVSVITGSPLLKNECLKLSVLLSATINLNISRKNFA